MRRLLLLMLFAGTLQAQPQVKISGLPAATPPFTGSELVLLEQSGTTSQTALSNLRTGLLPNLTLTGGVPSALTSWFFTNTATISGTGAGFATGASRACAICYVFTDTSAVPSGGSTLFLGQYLYGKLNAGWDGYHWVSEMRYDVNAAPVTDPVATANTNVGALLVKVSVNSSMGGQPGSHSLGGGSIFGFNPNIFTNNSTPQNLQIFNTAEFDVQLAAGSSAGEKHALTLVTRAADAVQGTYDDSALAFSNGNSPLGIWNYGIAFGEFSHDAPWNYTSTLIGAERRYQATNASPIVGQGVDLQKVNFYPGLTVTGASGSGTTVTLTFASTVNASTGVAPVVGQTIFVTGISPIGYNGRYTVTGVTGTTLTYASTFVTAYNSGGNVSDPGSIGDFIKTNGASIDPVGNIYGNTLTATNGLVNGSTGTVASITPVAFGGYTGGAYFNSAAFPNILFSPSPGNGNNATATVTSMQLTAALLTTGADSGCANGGTLTTTGGTGTQATLTLTVAGGKVTAVAITTPGNFSAISATPGTTNGTAGCAVQPTLSLGYGVLTTSIGNAGTNYPCSPAPFVYGSNQTQDLNTPAKYIANMLCTTIPITANVGAQSAPSWGTTGLIVGSQGTQTLTDTTSTTGGGTVTTQSGWSLPVYNFDCSAACTITNLPELYLPAPTSTSGNVTGTLYSLFAQGAVKVIGAGTFNGLLTGNLGASISGANFSATGGATLNGGTVTINGNSGTNVTNLCTGTTSGNCNIGGGSDTILVGSDIKINAVKWVMITAPTINSHFNTSGDTIIAANTAGFQVTVGTGTGTSTGSVTMPTAANGWACSVNNVTNGTTSMVQQTGSTVTSVTVTNFVRTTGVAGNFTNADKLNFNCAAF